jgi:HEAT repeat protein
MASLEEQLHDEFDKDEDVDYSALVEQLGPDALPELESLVRDNDPRMASQAAYLAGLIGGSSSYEVVSSAADSTHDVVRVVAAFTLSTLPPEQAAGIAERLLSDPDVGVRARAVRFAAGCEVETLVRRVHALAEEDPDETVREFAARLIGNCGGSQT